MSSRMLNVDGPAKAELLRQLEVWRDADEAIGDALARWPRLDSQQPPRPGTRDAHGVSTMVRIERVLLILILAYVHQLVDGRAAKLRNRRGRRVDRGRCVLLATKVSTLAIEARSTHH